MDSLGNYESVGIINPSGYFLPPMTHVSLMVNDNGRPNVLSDEEFDRLKDEMEILRELKPRIIDNSAALEYANQRKQIKDILDESPNIIFRNGSFSRRGCLPEETPQELTDVLSNMFTYSGDDNWILTATRIPEILLFDLIPGPELVIGVNDSLVRLLNQRSHDLRTDVYFVDKRMTGVVINYFDEDRTINFNSNGFFEIS